MNHKSYSVALVYDRVNKLGGAERVLLALHKIWPDAPLYTALYHPKKAGWAADFDVRPSYLNRCSFLRDKHEWLAPLMPYTFESFDFSPYDIVISVTSAEAKGILTRPNQLHLCYLLTPTKYLYQHELYPLNPLEQQIYPPFLNSLTRWDQVASSRPDHFIAISQTVAARCQKYYHRPVHSVIYPPVNCQAFKGEKPQNRYYLLVSRLVTHKRVDLAVQAFRDLPHEKLVVVGQGSEFPKLKKIAPKNVIFKGEVSDSDLIKLYHGAKAFIFPQEEDFGIAAVEAQAAGLPVIAYAQGGALETVIDGQTGLFFHESTPASLTKAILKSQQITWYHQNIVKNALRFDEAIFKSQFNLAVEVLWQQHQT